MASTRGKEEREAGDSVSLSTAAARTLAMFPDAMRVSRRVAMVGQVSMMGAAFVPAQMGQLEAKGIVARQADLRWAHQRQ